MLVLLCFFFFKQKTAYEMRISDWSSDVCSSDLMLMEIMGLHLPGASFVNPNTPLRDALTVEATRRALAITALGNAYTPAGEMIDERAVVNGVVGLHATGGSTNHAMHLVAKIGRAHV